MSNLTSIQKEIDELTEKYLLASTKYYEFQTKMFQASSEKDQLDDIISELKEKASILKQTAELTSNELQEFQIIFKSLVNILKNQDISSISLTSEIWHSHRTFESSINILYSNNELQYDVKLFTNRQAIFDKIKSSIQIPQSKNIHNPEATYMNTWHYTKKEYPTTTIFKDNDL